MIIDVRLYWLTIIMQKDLKTIDNQLINNHFVLVKDNNHKSQNSLFRALSMGVYFSHQHSNDIKQDLRLTLVSNLGQKKNSAYPPLCDTNILKKYQNEPELILTYWQRQQLQCFQNDNLNLASAAFGRVICLLTLDKEDYLSWSYVNACKNPSKDRLYLAKVGKKFYCVFEQLVHAEIKDVKECIIEQMIAAVLEMEGKKQREEKVIFHHYEDVQNLRRQHKKSLSDCDEVPAQMQMEDRKKEFEESSDRGYKQTNINLFDSGQMLMGKTEEEFFGVPGGQSSFNSAEGLDQMAVLPQAHNGYYPYYSQYYNPHDQNYIPHDPAYISQDQVYMPHEAYLPQQPGYGYIEPVNPINNERYCGRLKFFDQSGNYGFIVIDNINIDLFVHYDDLSKAGLSKQKLLSLKNNYQLRFQFTYYEYEGKQHKKSKKAVDLLLLAE